MKTPLHLVLGLCLFAGLAGLTLVVEPVLTGWFTPTPAAEAPPSTTTDPSFKNAAPKGATEIRQDFWWQSRVLEVKDADGRSKLTQQLAAGDYVTLLIEVVNESSSTYRDGIITGRFPAEARIVEVNSGYASRLTPDDTDFNVFRIDLEPFTPGMKREIQVTAQALTGVTLPTDTPTQ